MSPPRSSLWIAIPVLVGTCALVAVVITAQAASETTAPGYELPTVIEEVGAELDLAPSGAESQVIPRARAIDLAASAAGGLADRENPLSAQLVVYTNTSRGAVDVSGDVLPDTADRLVWVVRFTGTPQPFYGPPGVGQGPVATELNVILDAATGDVVDMFSYR